VAGKQLTPKEQERWRLARLTQDEDLRRNMAACDKCSAVRAEAIRHISDQEFLYQSANDPSPEVRSAAICGLRSPDCIRELALREKDAGVQYCILEDIRDTEVIAHYARSARLPEVREKAVTLLTDQAQLYEIFLKAEPKSRYGDNDAWESLATEAFMRITDEELLRKLARRKKINSAFRKWAMRRINDEALFAEMLADDVGPIAVYAASNVKSQDVLMRAVYTHANPSVRYEAMCGLDEQRLIDVIERHPEAQLRRGAIARFHNMPQSMAIRLALEDPAPSVRTAAIYHVGSHAMLLFFALNDPCEEPATAAYNRLKDPREEMIWRVLEEAVSSGPRLMAIRFCWNKEMLTFTAERDPDEEIRRRAKERLEKGLFN
jgi:hypothetical protein